MKKFLLAATFLAAAALSASAQYSVTLQRSGQFGQFSNCVSTVGESGLSASSWNVGGSDPFVFNASGGSTAPKITLAPLVINRSLDGCGSPQLQSQFLTGVNGNYTLTQYKSGPNGTQPVVVLTVTSAFISTYQIGGTAGSVAQESIALSYEKLCVTNYSYGATGASSKTEACFDQQTQHESPQFLVKGSAAYAK